MTTTRAPHSPATTGRVAAAALPATNSHPAVAEYQLIAPPSPASSPLAAAICPAIAVLPVAAVLPAATYSPSSCRDSASTEAVIHTLCMRSLRFRLLHSWLLRNIQQPALLPIAVPPPAATAYPSAAVQ